jgi:Fe-S-cluster containining protein
MPEPLAPIAPDRPFRFDCSPEVACFNACCRDLCQALSPYDVLRLKLALGVCAEELFTRYARRHPGPGSGLPVAVLAPADPQTRACPFVTAAGCRVYADRPGSCRTSPLVRIARRARDTGRVASDYLLLREPHCQGFAGGRRRTAAEWIADQGLADFDRWNDRLLELISLKNRLLPGALPPALYAELDCALYDLDRFRERFFQRGAPAAAPDGPPGGLGAEAALLAAAFAWAAERLKHAASTS